MILDFSGSGKFPVSWSEKKSIFRDFPWFCKVLGAPAGPAGPEPPEASRAAAEQSLSEDLEDFSSSEQGFGRFSENLQDSQRILIRFAVFLRRISIAGEVFDRLASLGSIGFLWIFLIFLDCGQAWPEAWRCGSRWISIKILRKNLGKFEKGPWKYRKPSQNNAY